MTNPSNTWTADKNFELMVDQLIARAKEDAVLRQQQDRDRAAVQRAAQGLINSGAFLADIEAGALATLKEAGARASHDVLMYTKRVYGEIPTAAVPWLRQKLTKTFSGLSDGLTRTVEDARRRRQVSVDNVGESFKRAALALKTDLEVELSAVELSARLRAVATGELPSEAVGERLWDIFISYASEDRAEVAAPLAEELINLGYRVWYDRNELKPGMSIFAAIEDGLRKSRFGVFIVSPAFFEKPWPRRELNAIATLADAEGCTKILPVWHNVDRTEVMRHSIFLSDIWAVTTSHGLTAVVRALQSALGPPAVAPSEQRER